jgi:CSLREA domain-containing protein
LSPRSFRRERERSAVAERRRQQLRLRRGGLVAGAAIGAFALAPAAAQAQNFTVNTLTDAPANGCTTAPGGCTLRDAMTDSSANSESDLITFASGLTGTLRLTQGELSTSTTAVDDVTVQGPGAGAITVSGDADQSGTPNSGDSRTFNIPYVDDSGAPPSTSLTISGLTLAHGYSTGEGGAAYVAEDNHLSLRDVTVTGNTGAAGAIAGDKYSVISIANSTISGNSAARGGAAYTSGRLTIQNSTLSGNHATGGAYGGGGAVNFGQKYGGLNITDSTISGNTATGRGGGIVSYVDLGPKYQATQNQITNTTISNNTSDATGGGLYSNGLGSDAGSFTIDHSTISNNHAGASAQGGGIEIGNTVNGRFRTVDSTISGNSANIGAGVAISTVNTPQVGPDGSISFDNSTVASNTAATDSGGMYLSIYGPSGGGPYTYSATIKLNSTIVGSNTANGASSDLGQADVATTGGFDLAFSLVQAPGDGVVSQANSIFNTDPQLGALGSNGGPTQTQLPSATSPVLDAGNNPLALGTDQRGDPRTVDLSAANAADATDIGAVEVPPPTPPAPAKKAKCKKKHKKKHKRTAESSKKHKKHKKCKKKKHKKKRH